MRRAHLADLIAVLLLSMTASGCTAEEPFEHTRFRPPPPHRFDADLSGDGRSIKIRYTFANDSGTPMVVFNGLPAADAPLPAEPDANAVYIHWGGGGITFVSKAVDVPPAGWSGPVHLLRGTVLPPQAELTEELTVPLPLTERGPYLLPRPMPGPVDTISFCVDFAPAAEVTPLPGGNAAHPVYAHADSTGRPFSDCSSSISVDADG